MKDKFGGFYGPTEVDVDAAYKDSRTIIVFDTNILLSLYRCEESTRTQFLEVWRNLKDQVWIPFHVCLEYQRNRLTVIQGARSSLKNIDKALREKLDKIFNEFSVDTLSRYSNLKNELGELKEELFEVVTRFSKGKLEIRRSSIDYINSHDELRDLIDELTEGRIGDEPTQKEIDEINKDGQQRYKYLVGPGFADAKGKQNDRFAYNNINYDAQYSDLYVWRQIIDEIKGKQIKKVIYVTNDEKEDFYYKVNGKTRGPSESLVTEMKKDAGVDIFLLHKIDSFLHHAVKSLNAKIDEPSISELASAAGGTHIHIGSLVTSPIVGAVYSAMKQIFIDGGKNDSSFIDLIKEHDMIKLELQEFKEKESFYNAMLTDENLDLDERKNILKKVGEFKAAQSFLSSKLEIINDEISKR